MTEVELNDCTLLYSYDTPVAGVIEGSDEIKGNQVFKTDHKWSVTTTNHINKWFREVWNVDAKTEVPEMPQENIYKLAEV